LGRGSRVCEGANQYGNAIFMVVDLVVNSSAAGRAEMECGLAAKASLRSKYAASSTLAREAVTNP
jgi:hypothetical protein